MADVSIIVTAYNIEGYIKQCLDSLTQQTLSDIEIIVVDDGSTDDTLSIIEACADADPRIKSLPLGQNSIGGVATPANAGLDAATADYVGFADGDDFCEPTMFEKLLAAAQAGDHDLSMCKYQLFDESTEQYTDPRETGRWLEMTQPAYALDTEMRKQFLQFIAVPWRKLYKRSVLNENAIRFPVGDYFFEDNPFHWFVLTKATSIAMVPEVLCYHRVARAGQTMETVDERLFKIFMHHDNIRSWLIKHDIEPAFRTALLGWVISQLEWISGRAPKDLRRSLFDVVAPIFANYSKEDVDHALTENRKRPRARELSAALQTNNYSAFNRCLESKNTDGSLMSAGLYHLRYSGVRHTAKLVGRYTSEKIKNGLKSQKRRIKGQKATDITNEDLMVAMVILQRQLKSIESRLRDLEKGERDK